MITILYAGLLGLLYIGLTLYVVRGRWAYKIGLGDGGNPQMLSRIRIHGNFAEFVPFALLLLFMTDYVQYNPLLIHLLGITLVLARVFHATGLLKSHVFTPWRGAGVVLTLAVILICSILLIWHFVALRLTGF